ncbi:MAG: choloylglycine hydrolase family protein [Candidatus Babeliales bacterium]|nr:choloylglycine hydrolase family protein [Candidatus Babeliales bacterium]
MCTGIRLIAQNNAVIYARTLEFAQNIDSKIVMIPRNYELSSTAPTGKGLAWKTTYAVVGANACDMVAIVDGINEQGLAGGLFYFPNYAQFQTVTPEQAAHSIAPWDVMTWILTTCATIAQVKETLPTIRVSNVIFGPWNMTPPVHAVVHDAQGNSLVIEYIDGKLYMHDNPIGTITNAPSFDWHLTNLKNYINLSALNVGKVTLGDVTLVPESQGSGMLGLPGDFTSPSRFIRATAFSKSVVNLKTEKEALDSAFHVLNLFDIPLGVVREKLTNEMSYEYTQWTSASDLKNKRYYFHTYDNEQIYMIDLMRMNLDAQNPVIIAMKHPANIIDVTP